MTEFAFNWTAETYYKTSGEYRRNIFVGGLNRMIDCNILVQHFSQFGEVWHAHIVKDHNTG